MAQTIEEIVEEFDKARKEKLGPVLYFLDEVRFKYIEIPWYHITRTFYRLKYAWQRAYRGYDDVAVFDTFSSISEYAYNAVSAYRKIFDEPRVGKRAGYCGAPEGFTVEEWKAALDDMIYFLKYSASDPLDVAMDKDPERFLSPNIYEELTIDWRPLHQTDARYKKGRKLFFKHYKSLWD